MPAPLVSLKDIIAKLSDPSTMAKERALYELVELAKRDASVHDQALAIFQQFVDSSRVVYLLAPAIRGIGVICGLPEAKRRWLLLLRDSDVHLVRLGLGELGRSRDAAMVGPIATLLKHEDLMVRRDAVTALGNLHAPDALPHLAECLVPVELRAYAVEAMGSIRDPRAILLLTPLLGDRADAWPVDNHGPMMTVGELVRETLAKLRQIS